ncbi:MAG: deoxyribose-phosphate aldolase [Chloroflexota bacterium]
MLEPASMAAGDLAALIDHTQLKPQTRQNQIEQLCREAAEHRFASVCVNSVYTGLCAALLKEGGVPVCTVVGFPLGASVTSIKVAEAEAAIAAGAAEIDMVLHVGALLDQQYDAVYEDIKSVADAVHAGGGILKVILETALLEDGDKVAACVISAKANADFVKTSTGFGGGGATVHDVALMRAVVGDALGVKASGGVRTYEDACRIVAAGASRIGASAGVSIVTGAVNNSENSY